MTTRKTPNAPIDPRPEANTLNKPTTETTTGRNKTARKLSAQPSTSNANERQARNSATNRANLHAPTQPPTEKPTPSPAATSPRPRTPTVEMTVTPVRKLTRPRRHQLSFRLPTDIPTLLTEAQQMAYDRGESMSRDLIVAAAIRQWVNRERAALARAKSKETDG